MRHVEGNTFMKLDGLLTRVVSQPSIRVKYFGTGADAAIYATNSIHASQVKSNPFTGNADGSYDFYIPNTRFNIEASGGTPVLGATLVSSDNLAFDPAHHFDFSNLNSGYVLQQNSAGVSVPVAVTSLGLASQGQYVNLTGVSCGAPVIRTDPGTGVPVLDVVMTGTGWMQAWRTSSGQGGAQTLRNWIDNLGLFYATAFITTSRGGAAAPMMTNTVGRSGLYLALDNVPALTASGGILTAQLNPDSGFVLSGKTFVGNACGLTTSSAIITASKVFALADGGVTQVASTATNITFTLSANAGFAAPVGTVIPIFRAGAGTVTVTSGGAVTILGTQFTVNSLSGASLEKIATDTWLFRA